MDWFRLYTDMPQDRKIRRLPVASRWCWTVILCMARKSPTPGLLLVSCNVPVTLQDVSDEANITIEDADNAIREFVAQGMLSHNEGCYSVVNWDKRQFNSSSTDRVRRFRERNNVKRFSNVSEKHTENREQKDKTPFNAPRKRAAKKPKDYTERFEKFWAMYPNKAAKWDAFQTYLALGLEEDNKLLGAIIKSVKLHAESEKWKQNNGEFVVHLKTFLNGRRWEDEVPTSNGHAPAAEPFVPKRVER